jgi:hypothetical protein
MAKKQTRRSVSIRGTTYDRIRSYCELEGISMSEFVEQRIAAFFDGSERAAAPAKAAPKPAKPTAPVEAEPPARAEPQRAEPSRPAEPARPAPRREAAPQREPRRSQRIAPRPAPPAKARVVAERAVGKQKLDFEEMQDAARFFTF